MSYKYINKRPISVPCGVHQDLLTFTGDFFSGLGGEDSMAPPTTGVVLSRWCLAPALLDLILGVGIRPVSEGKSGVTSLLNGIFLKIENKNLQTSVQVNKYTGPTFKTFFMY